MKRVLIGAAFALTMATGAVAFAATPAAAAPITCNGNQTATKVGPGEFACINNGGQDTGSVRPKGGNTNFTGPQYK